MGLIRRQGGQLEADVLHRQAMREGDGGGPNWRGSKKMECQDLGTNWRGSGKQEEVLSS